MIDGGARIEREIVAVDVSAKEFQLRVSMHPSLVEWLQMKAPRLKARPPLIIKEETYFLKGVAKKLDAPSIMVSYLVETGALELLRKNTEENTRWDRAFNPSLARFIEMFCEIPVEDVLIDRNYLKGQQILEKSPEERLDILINAYSGTWFDEFKEEVLEKSNLRRRKTSSEVVLDRMALGHLFGVNTNTIDRLMGVT